MVVFTDKIKKNLLEKIANLPELKTIDSEQLFIINEISWQMYESLLESVGDDWAGIRITYLEGTLEIMSPSRRHEFAKTNIGRLLDAYFEETRTRFYGLGSTTFRSELTARGIEPDECYCINSEKSVPDIAIEIVITSGGINSLEVYQGLKVSEVWFWENNKFSLYHLHNDEYEAISQSNFLPRLDLNLLASYVMSSEPLDAILEFRQRVREGLEK